MKRYNFNFDFNKEKKNEVEVKAKRNKLSRVQEPLRLRLQSIIINPFPWRFSNG